MSGIIKTYEELKPKLEEAIKGKNSNWNAVRNLWGDVSESLKNENYVLVDFARAGMSFDYSHLKHKKNDLGLALDLMKYDTCYFSQFSDAIQNMKEVAIAAVSTKGRYLEHLSNDQKKDVDIVCAALNNDPHALRFVSRAFVVAKNERVITFALKGYGHNLKDFSDEIRDNEKYVNIAIENNPLALEHASFRLKNEHDVVHKSVTMNGIAIKHAHQDLQNNENVAKAALSSNSNSYAFLSDELRSRKDIFEFALSKYRSQQGLDHNKKLEILEYADQSIQCDKEVVLKILAINGKELEHASYALRNDPEVVIAACQNYRLGLTYASMRLRDAVDGGDPIEMLTKLMNSENLNKKLTQDLVSNNSSSRLSARDELLQSIGETGLRQENQTQSRKTKI